MTPDEVAAIVRQIEVKDLSTAAHTWRVVLYTRAMLEEHGITGDQLEAATHGAALHDIGKLDIPNQILQKPGRLTDEEFGVIKTHPVTGDDRVRELGVDEQLILDLVRHHHERWDGTGYPDGLAGEDIPLVARYFAVIDTFDALTSVRPYRREIGKEAAIRALEIIGEGTGSHYWPDAARMFIDLYRSDKIDFILNYYNDEAQLPSFGD